MKLSKGQFYLAILVTWVALSLLYQSIWIFSGKTGAEILAVYKSPRRGITWMEARYAVDGKIYYGNYLQDGFEVGKRSFEIRYLRFAPGISRSNTFAINWGTLIMAFALVWVITSIAFLRKDIISGGASILIQAKWPPVRIVNNQVDEAGSSDTQVAGPEAKAPTEAEQALKADLMKQAASVLKEGIRASVYKFNPNAIAIFVVYVFFFFWYFASMLNGSLGYPGLISFGILLVFVPLYVQNTNNPLFKAKIPDGGSLVFSAEGVQIKDMLYSLADINAAVVYLESFRGFTYRESTTIGQARTVSSGDNNKISFRFGQEVIDLTFILARSSEYWAFRDLMGEWSAKGVNVLLERAFDDHYIIREMAHFQEAPDKKRRS
ncbi:MAG: hypothetical protein Q8927_12775 [Bacteroidota bacterium]|nr:hypothetical protein [Bacteroidota bacterium]MDP4217067.1 hypothetical protein [Bacteroidota bacterium]MDP4244411.1 hypothetical protein [Bacteroidota bacterium]MDP4254847.1 hypothetical protein [Bacteroidota bacterium]MDP4259790.1 hypothetical protein [Bacteroidota bacterium]